MPSSRALRNDYRHGLFSRPRDAQASLAILGFLDPRFMTRGLLHRAASSAHARGLEFPHLPRAIAVHFH